VNIDLTQNPKQELFYNTAIESLYGLNDLRNLSYGGGIRGGKSFICAAIWLSAAKAFPNSRWHIFRSDFPALSSTTIPTFDKIIAGSANWGWNRDKSNFFIYNRKTDSKIFFKAENIQRDPELNDLLGLETNGIWLEQIEELSIKLWEMAMSRNGSWYIDKMPTPIQLNTFNPTQNWIKEKIYEPWKNGELKEPYFFLEALPGDNKFVTKEQWSAWGQLADRYHKQFIEGDWTDFSNKDNLWAFAFDYSKHVKDKVEYNIERNTYLSFDFNRNPISCTVAQWYGDALRVVRSVKLANSDIYKLCDYILALYPNATFFVTGDATGKSSSALVSDNLNYYTVIKAKLGLAASQLKVPTVNPHLADNQVLFNSVLANYPVWIDKENCKPLIYDLQNVKMLPSGDILKADRNDPTQQSDALDNFRYLINLLFKDFLKNSQIKVK